MNQTMTATERSPGYYGCYVGISPPNFSVISNNTFINTSIEGAGWEYAINCLGCFNRWVNVRFERGGNQPTLPTQNVHVRFFGRDDVDPTTENILEAGLRQPDPLTVIEDANGTGLTGPSCCNNRVNRRQYAPYRFSNNQGSYATLQLQNKSAMNPPYLIMGYPAASDMDTQGTPPLGFGLAPTMLGFRQPADTDWRSYLDNSQIAFGPGTAALDTRMARDAGAGRFRFYGAPSPQDHAIGLSNNPNPSYPFYYSVVSGALNRYIYLVNATTTGAAEIGYIIACGTSAEKGAYGSFVGCNNLHANASLRGKIVLRNTDPGAQGVVLGVPYAGQSVEFQTNNFTQTVVAVDQQTTAGGIFETALLLRADGGIRRVLIGPADSGGTGFRALRVNSLYAPTGVVATPGVTQVALTWNAPSGALTYTVLQATALGGPYTTVEAGIAVNNKTVTGLTTGTPYYFKVSAQNASGTSDNSVVVTATPT
jgi:hypothetical protein